MEGRRVSRPSHYSALNAPLDRFAHASGKHRIDERLHRTVKPEKWLELPLGGAAPKFDDHAFDEEPPEPLPDALAASLSIDLRPRLDGAAE